MKLPDAVRANDGSKYWTPDSGGYRPTNDMVEGFKLPREAFRPFPDSTDAIFGTGRGRYVHPDRFNLQ